VERNLLAEENLNITGISENNYPSGFERRPPREVAPEVAKYYFLNLPDHKAPNTVFLSFKFDGIPRNDTWMYGMQISLARIRITANVAMWKAPDQSSRTPIRLRVEEDIARTKNAIYELLNVQEADRNLATLWIGPKAAAVPLVTAKDWFLLKDNDLILVKLPDDSEAEVKPVHLPVINWSDLASIDAEPIASGALADVYKAEFYGSDVAVKRFRGPTDDSARGTFRAEAQLLATCLHPSICRILAIVEQPMALVLEYAPSGSLFQSIHQAKKRFSTRIKLHIALDVAAALQYLHSKQPPLVHRDLKSANVLLTDNNRAKLADFGISRAISTNNTMTSNVGTIQWCGTPLLPRQDAQIRPFGN
jgi:tRNA A-37 threonylcarbamoyl transferase component Bud32